MRSFVNGIVAGFAATIVLSALMIAKSALGLLPEFNVIRMLGGMLEAGPLAGWVAHFAIGVVLWGGLFGAAYTRVPGRRSIVKGLWLGGGAWVLMMLVMMPVAGAGLFGLKLGQMVPLMTAVLHFIFGLVLGWVYDKVRPGPATQNSVRASEISSTQAR